MDRKLKGLREAWALSEKYSADIKDSPNAKYADYYTAQALSKTIASFIPIAISFDGEEKPMVNPQYGFDTADEAREAATKLLSLPGWSNTENIRIDVYAGKTKVGAEEW